VAELVEQLASYRSPSSVLDGDGKPPEPTEAELAVPIVAPGTDALLPVGIVYQAGWEPLADGMARHARAASRALAHAGFPVSLRSLPITKMKLEGDIEPSVVAEIDHLRKTSIARAPVAIRQVVLHSHQFLEAVVSPLGSRWSGFQDELSVYRSTIVYTSWERSTVHPELVEVLNRCGRVWVPCQMNKRVFEAAGVKRVDVIPCPYDPGVGASRLSAPRGSESVPGGKRFYAIGKWEPRKNYHALIGAFLSEFRQDERASLFVKTHEWGAWRDYPNVEQSLEWWLSVKEVADNGWTKENYSQKLRIATKKLSDEKLLELHRLNNIYVTCSHGEAWDLPAFDARAAGNRLVYTGYGGAEDYAGEEDMRIALHQLIAGKPDLEPVHSGYGWEPTAMWATCTIAEIRAALRLASPPRRRVHPPDLYRRFGFPTVGREMSESIARLSGTSHAELLEAGGFG